MEVFVKICISQEQMRAEAWKIVIAAFAKMYCFSGEFSQQQLELGDFHENALKNMDDCRETRKWQFSKTKFR